MLEGTVSILVLEHAKSFVHDVDYDSKMVTCGRQVLDTENLHLLKMMTALSPKYQQINLLKHSIICRR
jgi:hypothetical protein